MSELLSKETEPEAVKEDEGEDNTPHVEEESTATFTPVVKLEAVDVKTFEEDEDVLYKQRAKLFEFGEMLLDKGTGNKQWKERGVGDVKFLKHRETNRIRVLMRQEKTMKIIANHFLDPRITMTAHAGSDKSWVWVAYDFADYELVEKTFAIRFASPELAQEFKKSFEEQQAANKRFVEGLDDTSGSKEADEIASAVESLKVSTSETTPSTETIEVGKEVAPTTGETTTVPTEETTAA